MLLVWSFAMQNTETNKAIVSANQSKNNLTIHCANNKNSHVSPYIY